MKKDFIYEAYPNKYDLKNCNYKKTDNKYVDYSKFVIKKPWGYEHLIFQNKKYFNMDIMSQIKKAYLTTRSQTQANIFNPYYKQNKIKYV